MERRNRKKFPFVVEDFKTLLLTNDSTRQKISKNVDKLYNTISKQVINL